MLTVFSLSLRIARFKTDPVAIVNGESNRQHQEYISVKSVVVICASLRLPPSYSDYSFPVNIKPREKETTRISTNTCLKVDASAKHMAEKIKTKKGDMLLTAVT